VKHDNATVIRRFAEEVITQGRMDLAAQFLWEDVVEQVQLPGQGPGLEGLKIFCASCKLLSPIWNSRSTSRSRRATR